MLLITFLFTNSFAWATDYSWYSWEKTKGAAYYQGSVKTSDRSASFRTLDSHLLFELGSQVTVNAFDEWRRPLESGLDIEHSGPSKRTPNTSENSPEKIILDSAPQDFDEVIEAEASPKPDKAPKAYDFYLSLHFGLGVETLKSEGGVSNFSGKAGIGGTILRSHWKIGDAQNPSPWAIGFEVGGHNFNLTLTEKGATASTSETEIVSTYTRTKTNFSFLYDISVLLGLPEGQNLELGGGGQAIQIPLLKVENQASGEAKLSDELMLGGSISARYIFPVEDRQDILVFGDIMPFGFGVLQVDDSEGIGLHATGLWRYRFLKGYYSELGLATTYDSISSAANCPNVSTCENKAVVSSSILQLRIGVGGAF